VPPTQRITEESPTKDRRSSLNKNTFSPLWSSEALSARWGCSVGTLANRRSAGLGPEWVRIPGVGVRYTEAAILAHEATGERGGMAA
jgi:hypothetical protein